MQPDPITYYAPGTPVFVETGHEIVELGTVRGRRLGTMPLYVVRTALGDQVAVPSWRMRRAPGKARAWLATIEGRPA